MIGQGLLFVASLAVTLAASEVMARGLSSLGHRLRLSEGLVGLLTALGADAPELSSAVIAIAAGSRQIGVGVVLGSNLFNLAALLGLAALLSRGLRMHRPALLLDGAVGLLALLLTGLLLAGWLPPVVIAVLLAGVAAVYAAALTVRPERLVSMGLPRSFARALVLAPGHAGHSEGGGPPSRTPMVLLPLAVGLVVAGSFGLVHAAIELGTAWRVPQPVTGGLVLAVLTSLPNAYAAVHFGRRGRGTAVLSEAMNSNTLNLLGGLVIPAGFFGVAAGGGADYLWLLGLTVLALAWCIARRGMDRLGAMVLVAGYAGFVVFALARG